MAKRRLRSILAALLYLGLCIGLLAPAAMAARSFTEKDLEGYGKEKPKIEKSKKDKKDKEGDKGDKRGLGLSVPSDQKIYFSGDHNANRHIVYLDNPGMEVIIGHITGMHDRGILLDGEFYSTDGARIVDNYLRPATLKELYVGLKVNIIMSYGSVEKITVYDLFRMKTRVRENTGSEVGR